MSALRWDRHLRFSTALRSSELQRENNSCKSHHNSEQLPSIPPVSLRAGLPAHVYFQLLNRNPAPRSGLHFRQLDAHQVISRGKLCRKRFERQPSIVSRRWSSRRALFRRSSTCSSMPIAGGSFSNLLSGCPMVATRTRCRRSPSGRLTAESSERSSRTETSASGGACSPTYTWRRVSARPSGSSSAGRGANMFVLKYIHLGVDQSSEFGTTNGP